MLQDEIIPFRWKGSEILRKSVPATCLIWNYTVSQKRSTYNFNKRERILIFFGKNVTYKVTNRQRLYYATSNNLCFCTTRQNGETRKSHFNSNAVLVHCQNSTSCLTSSTFFDSGLILTLLYVFLNLVINVFSMRGCWGTWFRRKEGESTALCCTQCAVFWVSFFER